MQVRFSRRPLPLDLPQIGVSRVGESYAQRGEIAICLLVQRSNKPEREEFEKLPVPLVEIQ